MKRTPKDYIILTLKGLAMGAADVVPGVSGGTIAFISGIYEELLSSFSNININTLKTLKKNGLKAAWHQINGNFLLALFSGVFISIVSLAKLIAWLLENKPILLWSFFFGLVLASIIYIFKQITKRNASVIVLLILGSLVAYYITTLPPMVSESSSSVFIFFAGAIAICAMILPGISGSFILVIIGAYKSLLNAINTKDVFTIGLFLTGNAIGLILFSKVLKWLFKHYKNQMLAVLTGFIIGSLRVIWPWKKALSYRINSHGEKVPFNEQAVSPFHFDGNPQILYAVILATIGFTLILVLEKLATKEQ